MCPLLSMRQLVSESVMDGWVNCQLRECRIWDRERDCCSFNTKTRVENLSEKQFIAQLKTNIDLMLKEKTGWGRVELKEKLFNLLENTGKHFVADDDEIPF